MSGSLNRVQLIGNLAADPEVRTTQQGKNIVNLRIATSETWRDKDSGEKREKTEFHRVVIFNEGMGRIAEQYLSKGSKCMIEGMLQTRKWQDQDGNGRYSTEIVVQNFGGNLLLLGGNSGERDQAPSSSGRPQATKPSFDDDVDGIPF